MRRSRFLAGVLSVAAVAAVAATPAVADDDREVGGATTVVLDPELVPTLVDPLEVAPLRPATLTAPGGVAQLAFPITDIRRGVVSHSGGLSFRPINGGLLTIRNFDVDTTRNVLTAKTKLNRKSIKGRVPIFTLGAVQPINGATPPCDGIAAGLSLTPQAAAALGAPSFAGRFVGDACVAPVIDRDDDDDDDDDDEDDDD